MKKVCDVWRVALLTVLSVVVIAPVAWIAAQDSSSSMGVAQSPIDIRAEELTFVEHLPPLRVRYGPRITLDVVNTGSPDEFATVRADVLAGDGMLRISGTTYKLLQFHWHTPGEHEREGEQFPMEMHLVHQAANGALLVMGVWIVPGDEHEELQKIFAHLPEEEGEHRTVRHFNLRTVLPEHRASFRYLGSLTTPPFTEGV
jgi:carbonic anhydrase